MAAQQMEVQTQDIYSNLFENLEEPEIWEFIQSYIFMAIRIFQENPDLPLLKSAQDILNADDSNAAGIIQRELLDAAMQLVNHYFKCQELHIPDNPNVEKLCLCISDLQDFFAVRRSEYSQFLSHST